MLPSARSVGLSRFEAIDAPNLGGSRVPESVRTPDGNASRHTSPGRLVMGWPIVPLPLDIRGEIHGSHLADFTRSHAGEKLNLDHGLDDGQDMRKDRLT